MPDYSHLTDVLGMSNCPQELVTGGQRQVALLAAATDNLLQESSVCGAVMNGRWIYKLLPGIMTMLMLLKLEKALV